MNSAFAQRNPDLFNGQLAKYRQWLSGSRFSAQVSRARYESFYNAFQPFLRALGVYLVAFVLCLAALHLPSGFMHKSAMLLGLVAFALHTAGLLFEMMLEGRHRSLTFTQSSSSADGAWRWQPAFWNASAATASACSWQLPPPGSRSEGLTPSRPADWQK